MTSVTHPVIGELREQRLKFDGSKFKEFFWRGGIEGLAYVDGNDLHLLATNAITPGIGQFRSFINECKKHYGFIRCWAVINDDMPAVLKKYGFVAGHDTDNFGEIQEVWDWRA